jgi:ribulose bisphosphate carboxylase small subunit
LRPEYSGRYYRAFVFDPDGNNVEAVSTNLSRPDRLARRDSRERNLAFEPNA